MTVPGELQPVREGDVLAGKYRVERVLGAGGMGVVVAAHHLQLDQRVALKFLLPHALENAEIVARFEREARAAVRIRSEHVARVIDVGTLEGGGPYIVMEYLEGADLACWLDRRGALPVEIAVDLVLQACEAIAEAHAMGIVHRDLKPANLFCIRRADGSLCVKVLDFGISKVTGMGASGDLGMTRTSAIIGSPFYMSPEQMHGAKFVDARTDLWSLGVILFELLTNRVPFAADAIPELVIRVLRDAAPPLAVLRPDAPPGLDAVVGRCLEKDRDRRFRDVGELVAALVPFGTTRARHSLEVVSGVLQAAGGSASILSTHAFSSPALSPRSPTSATWSRTGDRGRVTTGAAPSRPGMRPLLLAVGGSVALLATGAMLARGVPRSAAAPAASHGVAPLLGDDAPSGSPRVVLAPAIESAPAPVPDAGSVALTHTASIDAAAVRDARGAWSASTARTPPSPPAPQPPPTAQPAQPPTAHCNPPYFYDSHGNKVFKLGCLT